MNKESILIGVVFSCFVVILITIMSIIVWLYYTSDTDDETSTSSVSTSVSTSSSVSTSISTSVSTSVSTSTSISNSLSGVVLEPLYNIFENINTSLIKYTNIDENDEWDYVIVRSSDNVVIGNYLYAKRRFKTLYQNSRLGLFINETSLQSVSNINHYMRLRFYKPDSNTPYYTYETNSVVGSSNIYPYAR